MILLDTNVLSELAETTPHPSVAQWASGFQVARFCTAAVCEGEILRGIGQMPPGRRHEDVRRGMLIVMQFVVGGRVLPFDRAAARAYAEVANRRRRSGRPVAALDLQIAAIGVARGLEAIATRNTADFEQCGVTLMDPWNAS